MKKVSQLVADAKRALQSGDLARAGQLCVKALRQAPRHLEALHLAGLAALQSGDHQRAVEFFQRAIHAAPTEPVMHSNLAAAFHGLGDRKAALASLERAAELDPGNALTQLNLGGVYAELRRLDDAERCLRAALGAAPHEAEIHLQLGNVLHDLGRLNAAVDAYGAAADLAPGRPDAHYNLGCVLDELGRHAQAEAAYRAALQLQPMAAEAHLNLATVLQSAGNLAAAAEHFAAAVRARPDWAVAHARLGSVQGALGEVDAALASFHRALARDASNAQITGYFSRFLAALADLAYTPEVAADLARVLSLGGVDHQSAAGAAIKMLKHTQPFTQLRPLAAEAPETWAPALSRSELAAWLDQDLMQLALRRALVADGEFEQLLTGLRRYVLAATVHPESGWPLPTARMRESLALQCFINEYAFAQSGAEAEAVETLAKQVVVGLDSGAGLTADAVLALAAYLPLQQLGRAEALLEHPALGAHRELLTTQIVQPLREAELRSGFVQLTPIEDATSAQVRNQYEESPYPRWVSIALPAARPLAVVLRELFPGYADTTAEEGPLEVLVAGCGTGKHALAVARRFSDAHVLALDLSRSSLAYAARMAEQLNVDNIEFAQADILGLGTLTRRFDLVESAGVLHHLAEPLAGWRMLRGLLKPGGRMRIGLYSRRARRNIEHAREFLRSQGFAADTPGIRAARQRLRELPENHPARAVCQLQDFYALSACRDLIFHVQETSFTPGQIGDALASLGLRFIGFEFADPAILASFRQTNPDPGALCDLQAWDEFETRYPDAFLGMFQFWCEDAR